MMKRREFLEAGIVTGAGLLLSRGARAESQTRPASDALHVAVIGLGDQGRTLIQAAVDIPGIRFRAICDIWEYRRQPVRKYLEGYKHPVRDYGDFRHMLDEEKGLHAVIVATPDFIHADQVNACLRAGLHVYCEPMMATSLDAARSMVRTARETGKLLQIGYQRRSSPRYRHVQRDLLGTAALPGQITHVHAQAAHRVTEDAGWPKKHTLADEVLRQHGYDSMRELRNWRWFRKYGGGPFAAYASHQIDVVNWFLDAVPVSVVATGGIDYYKNRQWCDNVTAVLEYPSASGTVRACFVVLTTTSAGGGHYEHFMGTEGSIQVAENPKWTRLFHEVYAPDWGRWVELGLITKTSPPVAEGAGPASAPVDPSDARSRETGQIATYGLPTSLQESPWLPHLRNFFEAIRGREPLNCPADAAFGSEVLVRKVYDAVEARRTIDLKPDDFAV